ncbi:hypothetical protein IQ250_11500 [Pseudanabaenaceae cyanobacterium LEGE 13415]|nr:hypothetical protein [Pseudanabaenaceae cyanobacterium LEGE 13415]
MESQPRELRYYSTENGECPFTAWLGSLRDRRARTKIEVRLKRVELGNFRDCKSVGAGVNSL